MCSKIFYTRIMETQDNTQELIGDQTRYARVSSSGQVLYGHSLGVQKDKMTESGSTKVFSEATS